MEYNGNELLEEILALKNHEPWEPNIPLGIMNNDLCNNDGRPNFDNSHFTPQSSSFFEEFSSPLLYDHHIQTLNSEFYHHPFCSPELMAETPSFLTPEESSYYSFSLMDDSNEIDASFVMGNNHYQIENGYQNMVEAPCKMEPRIPISDMGGGGGSSSSVCLERKGGRMKKLDGQPSKNLMAERRRRKRLNDRLSMLRSVVPKISKMDRTSILGDTIDYMKELLDRINSVQEEMEVGTTSSNNLNLINIYKNVKPNEILVRNSPKFEVERRNEEDSRIEICCAGKPGLLVSTVTTLEAFGLEIQHCVISCFNDFSLQASCSQVLEHRGNISAEDIRQELFRNAGYGGRCL